MAKKILTDFSESKLFGGVAQMTEGTGVSAGLATGGVGAGGAVAKSAHVASDDTVSGMAIIGAAKNSSRSATS